MERDGLNDVMTPTRMIHPVYSQAVACTTDPYLITRHAASLTLLLLVETVIHAPRHAAGIRRPELCASDLGVDNKHP